MRVELSHELVVGGYTPGTHGPFVNLPEASAGRWDEGLTAAKMKNCIWLRPEIVPRLHFLEWTPSDHLRHASFVGIRDDKAARSAMKEVESAAAKRKAP